MADKKIKELEEEIEVLKRKLKVCTLWMKLEVESQVHNIARRKVSKLTEDTREKFLEENQEKIISQSIQNYFWDILLLNAPNNTIEHLVNSEINYYSLQKNPSIDWFSVISNYHKILDAFIEHFITNNYRKFAVKKNCTILRVNDPLEKALHLVVNKKYIMSVWRLFWLLRAIKNDDKLFIYWETFAQYLDKYTELKDVLLSNEFMKLFQEIVGSEVFWAKRHAGTINLEDTQRARQLMTWWFCDKNSILYILLESQSVMY